VLGDDRHAGARQRLAERPLVAALGDGLLERGQRDLALAAPDLVARVVDDALQDVQTRASCWDAAT
jgi:hypothetical protein